MLYRIARDDDAEVTAEQRLAELEKLLDSPPDLSERSSAVMRGAATPARELLEPILRKLVDGQGGAGGAVGP